MMMIIVGNEADKILLDCGARAKSGGGRGSGRGNILAAWDFDVQLPRSRLGLEWRKAPPPWPENCNEGLPSDRRFGTIGRRESDAVSRDH